jgi:hypothetical protein
MEVQQSGGDYKETGHVGGCLCPEPLAVETVLNRGLTLKGGLMRQRRVAEVQQKAVISYGEGVLSPSGEAEVVVQQEVFVQV